MNRLTAIGFASLVAYGILLAAKWDGAPAAAGAEHRAAAPAAEASHHGRVRAAASRQRSRHASRVH